MQIHGSRFHDIKPKEIHVVLAFTLNRPLNVFSAKRMSVYE